MFILLFSVVLCKTMGPYAYLEVFVAYTMNILWILVAKLYKNYLDEILVPPRF